MITHVVLFKLKPGVGADDPRLERVAAAMAALPRQIALIKAWEQGPNLTADAAAWDYALRAQFDSEADLHAYFEHPAHLPVVDRWSEIATLAFADFRS